MNTSRPRYSPLAGAILLLGALLAALLVTCGPTPESRPTATGPGPTAPPAQATRTGPGADKQGGTLVLGLRYEPDLLNAYLRTQAVGEVAGALFERGLVQVRPDGTWAPDLAVEVPSSKTVGSRPMA